MVFKGHIGIVVPNVEEACKRFEKYNVEFSKRPNDGKLFFLLYILLIFTNVWYDLVFLFSGKMKGLAFIKDPDGYLIEILTNNPVKDPGA